MSVSTAGAKQKVTVSTHGEMETYIRGSSLMGRRMDKVTGRRAAMKTLISIKATIS